MGNLVFLSSKPSIAYQCHARPQKANWNRILHQIRASVQVRLGPLAVYIPLEIRDIQLHAVARITIRPLVETLPCLGALYVSLLDEPHIDMTCTLINNVDLMAVPGIHAIAHSIVQVSYPQCCIRLNRSDFLELPRLLA